MMANAISTLAALLGLIGLGACASTGTPEPKHGTCHPAAASALVGKPAPDNATIFRNTGSLKVRRIAPGDMTTMDYRPDRVTVTISDGQVVAASCG